jgi:hypothetical protein
MAAAKRRRLPQQRRRRSAPRAARACAPGDSWQAGRVRTAARALRCAQRGAEGVRGCAQCAWQRRAQPSIDFRHHSLRRLLSAAGYAVHGARGWQRRGSPAQRRRRAWRLTRDPRHPVRTAGVAACACHPSAAGADALAAAQWLIRWWRSCRLTSVSCSSRRARTRAACSFHSRRTLAHVAHNAPCASRAAALRGTPSTERARRAHGRRRHAVRRAFKRSAPQTRAHRLTFACSAC